MSATNIIINDETPRRQYVASSGQTVFDFPFPVFAAGDIVVYKTPFGSAPNDAADILTLTTDYTVSGADTQDSAGVTLNTGAAAGDIITIVRVVDLDRTTDYQVAGDLLAETLNREQDTEIMALQQLRADIDRSIKRSTSSTSSASLTLPEPEAGKALGWNGGATALENVTPPQTVADQIFDTKAALVAASITAGLTARTRGYTTAGDGGGATYLIKTAVDYAGTPDEYGDHTLANGNVAVLQTEGSVNVKQFGATGDGSTDDALSIQAAIDSGNTVIEGTGGVYKVSGSVASSITNKLLLQNLNLFCTEKNEQEFSLTITSTDTVEIRNFSYDGRKDTKYTNDSKWYEQAGGQIYGKSVWPISTGILFINSNDVVIDGISFDNVLSQTCLRVDSLGDMFINNSRFNNTVFCTIICTGISNGNKVVSNYSSIDNGRLPDTFLVKEIGSPDYTTVANRVDRIFFNQGAFGCRLLNAANYTVSNFNAVNYASSALVSDINNTFKADNVTIISNSAEYISNNTTAAIYSELTKDIQLSNITIDIQDRNTDDSNTWGVYFYQSDDTYKASLSDFNIRTSSGTFITDCIHNVTNYGGHVSVSNGRILSSGNNAISTRINFPDGYSGDLIINNVVVDGTAQIAAYDATNVYIKDVVSSGDIYTGNFGAGGTPRIVDIENVTLDTLTLQAIEDKITLKNVDADQIIQVAYSNPELVTNNDFSTTADWVKAISGGTFTVSGNKATLTNTSIYQALSGLEIGETYSVKVYCDRTSSNANLDVVLYSGIGGGATLGSITNVAVDGVYTFEFVATATTHSINLFNFANISITVFGRCSIKKANKAQVILDNVKVNTCSGINGSGRSNCIIRNSQFLSGGSKVFNNYGNVTITDSYFLSNLSAASVNVSAESALIFSNNTIQKGYGDNDPTYEQLSCDYFYDYTPINANNITSRG